MPSMYYFQICSFNKVTLNIEDNKKGDIQNINPSLVSVYQVDLNHVQIG